MLVLLLTFGCNAEGRVSIQFALSGDVFDDLSGRFLHVRIRDASGRLLGGVVSPGSDLTNLQIEVPHGQDRIAVLEVRDGADPSTAAVLAYGVSDPFALEVGDDRVVEVPVRVDRVAEILELTVREAQESYVTNSNVTLDVRVSRADLALAVIGQDPGLAFGRVERPLAGTDSFTLAYDLDEGCRALGSCRDGPRSVFVRVEDQAGYPSRSLVASIILDSQPPAILPGTTAIRIEKPGALIEPVAAGDGATVRINFALTEPVTSTPTLTLEGSGLAFTYEATLADSWIFSRVISPEDPEGRQQPVVTARDIGGNEVSLPLALDYVVDRTPPAAPRVDEPNMIVYARAAWGDAESALPAFSVTGQDGAVEPFATVQVYDGAEVVRGSEIVGVRAGEGVADENGAFRVDLVPVDRSTLHLLVLDASGNPHAERAVRVRDISWTVPGTAPGGAQPPTEVLELPRLPDSLRTDGPGVERVLEPEALHRADGAGAHAQHLLRWTEHVPASSPIPDQRRFAGATYDWIRNRAVMYGGRLAGEIARAETWEHDGSAWALLPNSGVEPRCDDGTTFGDDSFGYTAFVGGLGKSVVLCRRLDPTQVPPLPEGGVDAMVAYGWDGVQWAEIELIGDGESPSGRVGHSVVYDPGRGRLVMFGGNSGSLQVPGPDIPGVRVTLDETWELEVVRSSSVAGAGRLAWVQMASATTPPPRDRAAMVYDPASEHVYMFGGIGRDRVVLDDLWSWDGVQWTEIPTSGAWPPARAGHSMVVDPNTGMIGLIGGTDLEPIARQIFLQDPGLADAWWWDGIEWHQTPDRAVETPSGIGISAVTTPREAFTLSGATVGGDPNSPPPVAAAETWAVAPASWRNRTSSDLAPSELTFVAGYDSTEDVLRVFTSVGRDGNPTEETWSWSDAGWQRETAPFSHAPIGEASQVMVHDPVRRETILWSRLLTLNGFITETSELFMWRRPQDGGWTQIVDAPGLDPEPAQIGLMGAHFDAVRQEVLVLTSSRTAPNQYNRWHLLGWNGQRFDLLDDGPAAPFPQSIASGSFLFSLDDAAEDFVYVIPALSTSYRYEGSGAWSEWLDVPHRDVMQDTRRELQISVGEPQLNSGVELWELRNATWEQRATIGVPPPATGEVVYDPIGRRLLSTEASGDAAVPGAVYALDLDPRNRPAVQVLFDLAEGAVAPDQVRSVSITAVAGGRGGVGDQTQEGFELVAYDGTSGAWLTVATGDASVAAPARVDATVSSSVTAGLLIADPTRIAVAVTPAGRVASVLETPEVIVDQLVLEVRYRLPDEE